MEIIRGRHNLRPQHRGVVATIGNFDGVHQGHLALIAGLRRKAAELGLPTLVMIFEPQPQEFFAGDQAPPRLLTCRDKIEALAAAGVDRVLILRFDERLRGLTAEAFVQQILVDGIGVRHLVVGDDFHFGCDRRGDFAFLVAAGGQRGFTVEDTPSVVVAGERASSTAIRAALTAGEMDRAKALLGRPYHISGRVVHGDKLGRTIGVPTANLLLRRRVTPVSGVFAVWVHGAGPERVAGVANIGNRPTVNGVQARLEVHLLNFDGDLYGRRLTVELVKKLRDERRFASLDELTAAIQANIAETRALLLTVGRVESGD